MSDIGGCRCGAVNFAINGEIKIVVNCHCSICRKINGAAFSTYVVIAEDSFALISGAQEISSYLVSETATKYFCGKCGTPLYNSNPAKYNEVKIVHLGALNKSYEPQVNIYCDTKLFWLDNISAIKSFDNAR